MVQVLEILTHGILASIYAKLPNHAFGNALAKAAAATVLT